MENSSSDEPSDGEIVPSRFHAKASIVEVTPQPLQPSSDLTLDHDMAAEMVQPEASIARLSRNLDLFSYVQISFSHMFKFDVVD